MPAGTYAAIEGASQLYANLEWLQRFYGTDALPITLNEMYAVADDIGAEAKLLAPVRTGKLRDEIVVIRGKYGVEIRSGATYSLFVEFGTVRHPAQPFLRTAFHKYRYFTRVADRLKKELQDNLK